jgi:lipopolysaccharide exporter
MSKQKYGYWLHSGSYSLLQKLSVMLFGIASFFVLTRVLSTDHMGVWAHFLALTANIELIRHSIVKNAFVKYLNTHGGESGSEIITAALVLNIVVTAVVALLIFLLMPALSSFLKAPELTKEMNIFLLGLLFLIPFSHFEWIQISQGEFKGIFLGYLVRQGGWFLMMVIHLLYFGTVTLPIMALYYDLGILCGGVVSYFYARKFLSRKIIFIRSWFTRLWKFGRIIFGSSLSTMVFRNIDQMMVSNIVSLTAVALYNVSLRIINLLDLPSQIIGDIMFPKSSQVDAKANPERLKMMYEKSVGAVLSVIIPCGILIFIFPKLFLLILAGKKYLGAVFIIRLMLINGIFMAFIKQFATIMDSSGKAKINLSIITTMAFLSIILCYVFTKWLGLPGAVVGIIVTHSIGFCLSQYYLNKHYKIQFWNAFGYAVEFYPEMFRIFKHRLNLKNKLVSK